MKLGEGQGWNSHPDAQPRNCHCGRKVLMKTGNAWFKTSPPLSTKCSACLTTTLLLSYCGCAYCETALAAIEDARAHHRRAT